MLIITINNAIMANPIPMKNNRNPTKWISWMKSGVSPILISVIPIAIIAIITNTTIVCKIFSFIDTSFFYLILHFIFYEKIKKMLKKSSHLYLNYICKIFTLYYPYFIYSKFNYRMYKPFFCGKLIFWYSKYLLIFLIA